MERPLNANQLAGELGLDYTTVQHHLRVLTENGLIHGMGPNYGRTYFLTEKMEAFAEGFAEILEKLEEKRPPKGDLPENGS